MIKLFIKHLSVRVMKLINITCYGGSSGYTAFERTSCWACVCRRARVSKGRSGISTNSTTALVSCTGLNRCCRDTKAVNINGKVKYYKKNSL